MTEKLIARLGIMTNEKITIGGHCKKPWFWFIFGTLAVVFIYLNLLVVFSDRGLIQLERLKGERSALQAKVKEIEAVNQDLMAVIKRLAEKEPALIEHIAHHELKLLGDGELIVIPPNALKDGR